MEQLYLYVAVLGGTLMLCQFLAGLLGFAADAADADHDVDHNLDHGDSFLGWLTFRAVSAALTFFGLAGLAASGSDIPPLTSLVIALAAGAAALYLVAALMKALRRLQHDGTVRVDRAVGQRGTVYLTVPGRKAGAGKVTLALQNRTVELRAVTAQDDLLPTGTPVTVVAVLGPDCVEVSPAPNGE